MRSVTLAPYDDLFSTEESRQDAKLEKVREIPLSELHPFKNHPFKVKDDEAMLETADSVRQYGILVPAIARPDPEGGYELVAGHRRHRASELAEKETMPVIVRDLQMDAATPDSDIREKQVELNQLYDDFSAKYGLINDRGNRLAFADDSSYYLLCALEVIDENGQLKHKADMFTKRTIKPHEAVTSVDTASEALAVSIAEKARVDMLSQDAQHIKEDRQLTAALIDRLIDRIEVSREKRITVRFRFQSEFEHCEEVLSQCRNM